MVDNCLFCAHGGDRVRPLITWAVLMGSDGRKEKMPHFFFTEEIFFFMHP